MKRVMLGLVICFGFVLSLSSCKDKEHKHSEDTHMHDDNKGDNSEKDVKSNSVYQCPMDCEKGKSYSKDGSCPICKMNLKPKEVTMDSEIGLHKDYDKEGNHLYNEDRHSDQHN